MIYNNKMLFEIPFDRFDQNRAEYICGFEKYIENKNIEAKLKRENFINAETLTENIEFYRNKYKQMLGVDKILTEHVSKPEKEYIGSDEICDIYTLKIYITKEIPMFALMLVPHDAVAPYPLVIAQHGGGGTPELCSDYEGKNNYNHMVQRILERRAAVIAPQLMLWGTNDTETHRKHDIPYNRREIDNILKRFGLSITGVEVSGIMRCIDYGCSLPEINSEKIGMIGLSYGGYFTMHTMAADTRIKAGYAAGFFNDRDIYPWSDWSYNKSAYTFQDAEVAALCAPRRLYISVGKQDKVFDWSSSVSEAERAKTYYNYLNAANNFVFSVWDGGHTVEDSDAPYDFVFGGLDV